MLFLNSMTFHDQGAPWTEIKSGKITYTKVQLFRKLHIASPNPPTNFVVNPHQNKQIDKQYTVNDLLAVLNRDSTRNIQTKKTNGTCTIIDLSSCKHLVAAHKICKIYRENKHTNGKHTNTWLVIIRTLIDIINISFSLYVQ